MEISKFNRLKESYEEYIKAAEEKVNGDKAIEQTKSIWFDRKKIENLLEQTDQEKGGIRIFFGRFSEETLEVQDSEYGPEYSGKLMLILTASNENENPEEEQKIVNAGWFCPPNCG